MIFVFFKKTSQLPRDRPFIGKGLPRVTESQRIDQDLQIYWISSNIYVKKYGHLYSKKQMDNLKTNDRGIFVLIDINFIII